MQEKKCKLPNGVQVSCTSSEKYQVVRYLIETKCPNPGIYNGSGSGEVGLDYKGKIEYSNKCSYDKIISYAEFEKLIAEPIIPKEEIINNYSIF